MLDYSHLFEVSGKKEQKEKHSNNLIMQARKEKERDIWIRPI